MQVTYKILFTVDILNDYYRDGRCADFKVMPSEETASLLKKYNMLYRMTGNRLVILVKIKDDNTPVTPIDPNTKFSFYMDLQTPAFVNFTNINLDALATKRFYFSNLNGNENDNRFNLTAPVEDYNDDTNYTVGQFADDGTGNIFECIQGTQGNDTTTAFWVARGKKQYASMNDMRDRKTMIFDYTAPEPAVDTFKVNVFSINKIVNTYNNVAKTQTQKFSKATRNIRIDMSDLNRGSYHIEVNKKGIDTYSDDSFVFGGYFGVIEIFSHLPNGNAFAFLDNAGKVIEKTYTLRFANRMAFWKYITPKQGILSIKDKDSQYEFDPANGPSADFISTTPIPISQASKTFTLDLVKHINSKEAPVAPGPDLMVSGVVTKKDDNLCYNIYLNY